MLSFFEGEKMSAITSLLVCMILSMNQEYQTKIELPSSRHEELFQLMDEKPAYHVPVEYKVFLEKEARLNRIPYEKFERLCQSESDFRNISKPHYPGSKYHDRGIFQFNSKWQWWFERALGKFDPMKPEEAAGKAALWFRICYNELGSWYLAALAFKCGLNGWKNAPDEYKRIARWIDTGKGR